jgi:uncharacterized protein YukE
MSAATVAVAEDGDRPPRFSTDFAGDSAGGLLGLRAMIETAEPESLDTVSARWSTIHQALLAAQADLREHTSVALHHWEGEAADGFADRSSQLSEALSNGAAYAANASTGVSTAADALRLAQKTIPTVPSAWDRLNRKLDSETDDHAFTQDLTTGTSRAQALKLHGTDLSLLEERHQQAVVVMQQLEASYNTAATIIGDPPSDPVGTHGVYPPPPVTTKRSQMRGAEGVTVVTAPGAGDGLRLAHHRTSAGDGDASTPAVDPRRPVSAMQVNDHVSGGDGSGPRHSFGPHETGTAIQWAAPGVHAADSGAGSGTPMMNAVPGSGIGEGNVGAVPFGILICTRTGHGETRAEHEGRITESGGTSEGGVVGADKLGGSRAREGFVEEGPRGQTDGSADVGNGQGRSGIPGGAEAGKQDNRRKRRARAHYLLEEEGSWTFSQRANPPVIS